MDTPRKYRTQVVHENADDGSECFVPCVGGGEVELVDKREAWPEWNCDGCGTHNDRGDLNCAYCGAWRGDIDSCG